MRGAGVMGAVIALGLAAGCDYDRRAIAGDDGGPDGGTDAGDTPADADADAAASCVAGALRCAGNTAEECRGAMWMATQSCASLCNDGACVTPPSCSGGAATCGPGGVDACCHSLPVPGGIFSRSYDGVSAGYTDPQYHAQISDFHLDKYEVTVARFQAFVDAYPADQPTPGAGRNPHDPDDPGWLAAWTALLPSKADLVSALGCAGAQVAANPVRCASWYVAQAFYIWDGGRLPTEAEWNYAAAGGDEQRVYPWSSPPSSATITGADAIYQASGPDRPGARSPAGDARWGHSDLAGNVWEWVSDNYADPYPSNVCNDCANHTVSQFRGNRGGSYANNASAVINSIRGGALPGAADKTIGFRCARNPH